jgi:alkyl hydroperoxide reductase subunit AhpC
MSVEVGQAAPEFTLKDQAGNDVSLSDYRGKQPVVLVFYPFTFTGVCQGELCEIRDDPSTFENANAAVLAISCDTRHARPSGRSSRASRSRSSPTSGPTVRSPGPTACSTSSSAAPTGDPS